MSTRPAILVTGGAGYIGSHCCRALDAAGYRPVCYDNFSTGHQSFVTGALVTGDIADKATLARAFAEHNIVAVMHFAAASLVGESMVDPQKYYLNNLAGTLALLDAMRTAGCRRLVFSSSGAVYGNAGAFGGDMTGNMIWAELLTENGREKYTVEQMGYGYRTSILKHDELDAVVLAAELRLSNSTREDVTVKIEQFSAHRKTTQPPGASMGSMFKNPPGDYAGRLIEACGLKGTRIGNAEISPVHGNFFVNHANTKADDILALIQLVQKTVREQQGVDLELEIELIGEWDV